MTKENVPTYDNSLVQGSQEEMPTFANACTNKSLVESCQSDQTSAVQCLCKKKQTLSCEELEQTIRFVRKLNALVNKYYK